MIFLFSIRFIRYINIIFFLFFIVPFCGPPKPDKMPEPNNIYQEFSKNEIQEMLNSEKWQLRSTAILYIQQKKWNDLTNKLMDLLKNDSSSAVRQIAALTLSEFQHKEALPIILQLLKHPELTSKEKINITYLIDAIANYCDYNSLKEITYYLNDDDLIVRLHIVNALEKCNNLLNLSQKNEIGKILLSLAQKNQNPDKHRTYAMALGRIQYKPAESYLLKLLQMDQPSNTKAASILALGKIKSIKSIPLLISYLKTYPDKLGENSFIALKEIRNKAIINPIFPLLDTETKEIQLLVVDILAEINHPSIGDIAYSKLKENNSKNIGALCLLLGKLKYEKALEDIKSILLNKNSPDREIIAKSLGWMQNKEVVPILIQVLQENDGEGRYGAAWSLGILEAKEALPYLIKTAQSNDKKLAILSIEALGHIKSKEALPVLEKLTIDSATQIYALNTIGEIPGEEALEILTKFAKQKGEISHIAIEVLSNRKEPEVVDILIDILKNTNTEDIKAKIIYKALQRKTKKDFITKNQWLEWYNLEYKKQ
ncbi:MAG: hypothetical protein KatS3mg129_1560 [Leptospiraceae bacterium]|nr:MAG: hypothetical protein KatS3mg129_1560 [Leptospiraceae bacterium]